MAFNRSRSSFLNYDKYSSCSVCPEISGRTVVASENHAVTPSWHTSCVISNFVLAPASHRQTHKVFYRPLLKARVATRSLCRRHFEHRRVKMTITMQTIRQFFAAALTGVALVATGCTDSATRDDVSDARENLREEQSDLAEAQQDAQDDVAEARDDAQEHTVGKPVASEDAAEARDDVAEARHEAAEDIADEKEDVQAAAAELKTEEQRLQATQARDAYVKDIEAKLAAIEKDIDQLEEQASTAADADKNAINLRIEAMQAQHDRAQEALDELKSADLATWQNHQQHVRVAMQELERDVR